MVVQHPQGAIAPPPTAGAPPCVRDERGVVAEWLLKIVIAFAVAGVLLFDAGAIVVNYVTLDSTANDIAIALSTEVASANMALNDPRLRMRAEELAGDAGARLLGVSIAPDGVLRIRLAREADTVVVSRIDALQRWGRAVAGATASTR